MTNAHLIELVIVAIILIVLYIVSKRVDDGLKFLKNEINSIRDNMVYKQLIYTSTDGKIKKLDIEPSFASKIKNEEKRLNSKSKSIVLPYAGIYVKKPKVTTKKVKK